MLVALVATAPLAIVALVAILRGYVIVVILRRDRDR